MEKIVSSHRWQRQQRQMKYNISRFTHFNNTKFLLSSFQLNLSFGYDRKSLTDVVNIVRFRF